MLNVQHYRTLSVAKLLVDIGLASSRTEADRLIKTGSVEIDGQIVRKFNMIILTLTDGKEVVGYR
jgi:tyrosyl-tRNA synthetase